VAGAGPRRAQAEDVVLAVTCGQGHEPRERLCVGCPVGKYKPSLDNATCFACPVHAVTAQPAAIAPEQCVCKSYFQSIGNVTTNMSATGGGQAGTSRNRAEGGGRREGIERRKGGDEEQQVGQVPTCKPMSYVTPDVVVAASTALSAAVVSVVAVNILTSISLSVVAAVSNSFGSSVASSSVSQSLASSPMALISQVQMLSVAGAIGGEEAKEQRGDTLQLFSSGFQWANYKLPISTVRLFGGGGFAQRRESLGTERDCGLSAGADRLDQLITSALILIAVSVLRGVLCLILRVGFRREVPLALHFPAFEGPVFLSMCMAWSDVAFAWIGTACVAWMTAGGVIVFFLTVIIYVFIDQITYERSRGEIAFEAQKPLVEAWEQEGEARILRLHRLREEAEGEGDPARRNQLLKECREEQKQIIAQAQEASKRKKDQRHRHRRDESLLEIRPQRKTPKQRIKGIFSDYAHLRTRGDWVWDTRAAHRWKFLLSDFSERGWFYGVWVIMKKVWLSAAMALSGGMLQAVLAIGAQFTDAAVICTVRPYGDRQQTGTEIFSGLTTLLSFVAIGVTVMVPFGARLYLGDVLLLCLSSIGTVFTAFVCGVQSIYGLAMLIFAVLRESKDELRDSAKEPQKGGQRQRKAGDDDRDEARSLEGGEDVDAKPTHDVACSGCGVRPIRGGRWICQDCKASEGSQTSVAVDVCDACRNMFVVDSRYASATREWATRPKHRQHGEPRFSHELSHTLVPYSEAPTHATACQAASGKDAVPAESVAAAAADARSIEVRVDHNGGSLSDSREVEGREAGCAPDAPVGVAVEIEAGGGIGPVQSVAENLLPTASAWEGAITAQQDGFWKPTLDAWIEPGPAGEEMAVSASRPDAKLGFVHTKS